MVGDGATPWMEHFAHSFARDQQGQFMADAFFALENRKTMIAEAPTGLGKTAASLASALAAAKKIEGVEKDPVPDWKAESTQDCRRNPAPIRWD